MATTRVAHVSFAPGATHLKLQLRLQDDRKSFFRLSSEKLERVRYRLQLLAAATSPPANSTATSKAKKKHRKKLKNGVAGGVAPSVAVKFLDADGQEINAKTATVGDALMRTRSLQVGAESFVVLHNQPLVTGLKVLEPVMAGIPLAPLPETEFCSADECSWRWFRLEPGQESSSSTWSATHRS
ncbi:putative 2',5'-phosphodiesterase [Phytophthora cinnamomi]|uniref:putative 2',5'-phosphodiesterase n=1 Tax=Phytophthora cinnamomi TaxID=4785 RepID=UPI003559681B|nr:putative 2',5'-phosphodiesterase [Phytophthora cinnamomi]